jgi:glycosyltransferase involved in cell wall biosynthesis
MRILHLIYDQIRNPWVGGGGAVRVFEINERLSARGHQITVVCGMYPGARDYAEGNMEIKHVGSAGGYILSTFSYAFSAHRYLKEHCLDYDVVIEDFAPWNPLFSYRYQGRATVMLQIQNYLGKTIFHKYNIFGLPFYWIERRYPLKFKKTIVVNRNLATRFDLAGSCTLSNGIDPGLLAEKIFREGDYVAYMGRIDMHQKGLDVLARAIKDTPVKLKIAGDGKDRERFLRTLKDCSNAEWVGMVKGKEKMKFLSEAKFFVVPSRFEGQGIVVLEAGACQKPVIVSDIPELKYAIDAGFGISFKSGDPKDLAQKIAFLQGNEAVRRQMGRRGRDYARNFTWDRIALEYENFLLSVVDAIGGKEDENPDIEQA